MRKVKNIKHRIIQTLNGNTGTLGSFNIEIAMFVMSISLVIIFLVGLYGEYTDPRPHRHHAPNMVTNVIIVTDEKDNVSTNVQSSGEVYYYDSEQHLPIDIGLGPYEDTADKQ